jgi:manganese/iron transport system permease protein
VVTTVAVGVVVLGALGALHKELVLGAFDPAGATAMGYPVGVLDGVLLVAVTITLVAAVPAVGTLLAIALLTVPALTARLWTDRLGPTMALAAALGATSGFVGLCAAALWSIAAGGAIVLTAGTLFAVSFAATAWHRPRRPEPAAR